MSPERWNKFATMSTTSPSKMTSPSVRIPTGFKPLLEELTMEILRAQPDDIVHFAAEYLKTKLQSREAFEAEKSQEVQEGSFITKEKEDFPSICLPHVIVNSAENRNTEKKRTTPKRQQEPKHSPTTFTTCFSEREMKASTKIQACYRGHRTRKELKKQGDAATVIQKRFRKFQQHKILLEENEVFPLARSPGELQVLNELYRTRESFSFNFADTPLNQFNDDDLFFDSESDDDIDKTVFRLQNLSSSSSKKQDFRIISETSDSQGIRDSSDEIARESNSSNGSN